MQAAKWGSVLEYPRLRIRHLSSVSTERLTDSFEIANTQSSPEAFFVKIVPLLPSKIVTKQSWATFDFSFGILAKGKYSLDGEGHFLTTLLGSASFMHEERWQLGEDRRLGGRRSCYIETRKECWNLHPTKAYRGRHAERLMSSLVFITNCKS